MAEQTLTKITAEMYYEPIIISAAFVPNPVYENHPTLLRVYATDVILSPEPLDYTSGEFTAGEV